ncbi:MAG: hypothetical protein ACREKL_09025 [Chthoniobacterales bacterium]
MKSALLALACLAGTAFASTAEKKFVDIVGDRTPMLAQRTMISPTPAGQRLPDLTYIGGYEAIGKPVTLSKEQSAQLAALLKNPGNFASGGPKLCGFRPGVAFRFGSGDDAVDLLVCFSCDEVAAVPYGKAELMNTGFPQATRDILLSLAKALFPNDEAIQALPKVRSENPAPPPAAPVPEDAPRPGDATEAQPST